MNYKIVLSSDDFEFLLLTIIDAVDISSIADILIFEKLNSIIDNSEVIDE